MIQRNEFWCGPLKRGTGPDMEVKKT